MSYPNDIPENTPSGDDGADPLLSSHGPSNFAPPTPDIDVSLDTIASPIPPTSSYAVQKTESTIGPYRLLSRLGSGGMGEVWVAQQERPVKRQVALKLIQTGLNSREVISRFESERQALALMNHPNIARILDVGATPDGQPYFVMELIHGEPLTRYCDSHHLGIQDRLALFSQVCEGVQHAHQKGIIHRDLKPGNILVCQEEGSAVPKVIDFGLAKAVDGNQRLSDATLVTEFGQVLGTLRYMSPEQTQLNSLDIDTRTDVYALGIILYELLTGSTPLDEKSLRSRALLDILSLIRNHEPPKPSDHLARTEAGPLSSITKDRQTDNSRLRKMLLGDLDWIVMKALEKERSRRYDSPSGLAADIQRYLQHEPVIARPPSINYRISKFVRKNRLGVTLACLLFSSLLVGLVGTSFGLWRAYHQQQIAVRELSEKEKERAKANRNLQFARKANDVLKSVFTDLDPNADYKTVGELRNALRIGLLKADQNLKELAVDEPVEIASTQYALGVSLLKLGLAEEAIGIFESVYGVWKGHLGEDNVRTLMALNDLALSYKNAGNLDEALRLMKQSSDLQRIRLGPDDPETITGMHNLALVYQSLGRHTEAIPLFLESWQRSKAVLGEDHLNTVSGLNSLAHCYQEAGQESLALTHLLTVYEWCEGHLDRQNPLFLSTINNLALCYHYLGQVDKALPFYEESYRIRESIYGKEHPSTLTGMHNLAAGYQYTGQVKRALELWNRTLDILLSQHGESHPDAILCKMNLADCYLADRQLDQSQKYWEESYRLCNETLSDDHPNTLRCLSGLTSVYLAQGKVADAIRYAEQAVERTTQAMGTDRTLALSSMTNLSGCYRANGELDRAIEYAERAAKGIEGLQFQSDISPKIMANVIACYEEANQLAMADAWREKWLAFLRESQGEVSTAYAGELANFGKSLIARQDWKAAEEPLRTSLHLWTNIQQNGWIRYDVESLLGYVLAKKGMHDEAERLLKSGIDGLMAHQSEVPQKARFRLREIVDQLIELAEAQSSENLEAYRQIRTQIAEDGFWVK